MINKLYLIYTDQVGGDWRVVQGKDEEETIGMLNAGGFVYGDQFVDFYTSFLTERHDSC